jgi:murein L,D-transpeptidase YafK
MSAAVGLRHALSLSMSRFRLHLWIWSLAVALLLGLAMPSGAAPAAGLGETWILVDTAKLTLDVLRRGHRLLRLKRISIGRGGAGPDRRRGDDQTPLGRYRVVWLNPESRFHYFIGLSYPNRGQVERAFRKGVISRWERHRLLVAIDAGRLPPQGSPLGGQIGIHGLGVASRALHDIANWTEGCIALTDAQIDRLRRYISIGMPVVIR